MGPPVESKPDLHGADMAILLTDRPASSSGNSICGVAGGIDNSPLHPQDIGSGAYLSKVYAVAAIDCADIDRTFHHELAHNMGGWHDLALTGECGFGSTSGQPGSSCGYTGGQGKYRSIMGSNFSCGLNTCPRLLRFSSPNHPVVINGISHPTGDSAANFAATLQTEQVLTSAGTIALAASYRSPPYSAPGVPPSTTVQSCYSTHDFSWTASSGVVGWYEVHQSYNPSYTGAFEIYRGASTLVSIYSGSTFYLRVRACNGTGCSGWRTRGPISNPGTCS